jgi:hypothetical protein
MHRNKQTFVFLQIGNDQNIHLFIKSIQLSNPQARIIQCTDQKTSAISGVTEVFRIDSNAENLMTFRLEAFSKLNMDQPAIYLDTDMLVLKKIEVDHLLKNSDAALCRRSFGRNSIINTKYLNMNISEYKNKKMDDIYPFLACFTITKSYFFWEKCFENLMGLDRKFHYWYGDQEAIRNVAFSEEFMIEHVSESLVACLPEYISTDKDPLCLHFKGPNRKPLMENFMKI